MDTTVAAPVWGREYVAGMVRKNTTVRYEIGLPGHPLGGMLV